MPKYLFKRQLARQLRTQHDHPRHPEEDEVTARLQDGVWVEALKIRSLQKEPAVSLSDVIRDDAQLEETRYLLRPAQHGERKQRRGEPGIQNVRV